MTSNPKHFEEEPIDVSRESIMRLHREALRRIEQDRGRPTEMWWDGYLCALKHVIDMEGQ